MVLGFRVLRFRSLGVQKNGFRVLRFRGSGFMLEDVVFSKGDRASKMHAKRSKVCTLQVDPSCS